MKYLGLALFFGSATITMLCLLELAEDWNDKPWGLHATRSSYWWTIALGALFTLTFGCYRRQYRTNQWEIRLFLSIIFWILCIGIYMFVARDLVMDS